MAIEIVDFPIKNMVDLSIVFCMFTRGYSLHGFRQWQSGNRTSRVVSTPSSITTDRCLLWRAGEILRTVAQHLHKVPLHRVLIAIVPDAIRWQWQFHTVIPADLRDWDWRSYNAVGKSPFQTAVYLQDLTCQHLKISPDISNSQATSHHLSSANSEWWNMIQPHFWCNLPIISSTTVAVFFPRRVTHIPPPHWDRKRRRDARSHRHPQGTQRWVGPTERSDQTAPGFFGLKMLRKVAMEIQQLVWIDMSWSNLFTDVN